MAKPIPKPQPPVIVLGADGRHLVLKATAKTAAAAQKWARVHGYVLRAIRPDKGLSPHTGVVSWNVYVERIHPVQLAKPSVAPRKRAAKAPKPAKPAKHPKPSKPARKPAAKAHRKPKGKAKR